MPSPTAEPSVPQYPSPSPCSFLHAPLRPPRCNSSPPCWMTSFRRHPRVGPCGRRGLPGGRGPAGSRQWPLWHRPSAGSHCPLSGHSLPHTASACPVLPPNCLCNKRWSGYRGGGGCSTIFLQLQNAPKMKKIYYFYHFFEYNFILQRGADIDLSNSVYDF